MQWKNTDMWNRVFIILIVAFLFSCKSNTDQNVQTSENQVMDQDVVEVELDSTFVKFYNRFHIDSVYQLDHVVFPMKNTHDSDVGPLWTAENWVMHKPFSDMGGMFTLDYQVLGNVVVEKINDYNGFFQMERRFGNLSSGWQLIYYHIDSKGTPVEE